MINFKNIKTIAEVGLAHEGSYALACSYILSAKKAGADAVKFQTHIAEDESSKYDDFRIKSPYIIDKNRKSFWERTAFDLKTFAKLKKLTEKNGMFFLSSPFSIEAVELLKKIKISAWKIGSGELTNLPLINKIAQTKKPIILSTGLSNFLEIKKTIDLIKTYHNKIILMQCTSLYPCPLDKIGLNVIQELKKKFNLKVGFSDHSGDPLISYSAITQGADIVEAHVTYDKDIKTFDGTSSLNFKEFEFLTRSIKTFERITKNRVDKKIIPIFLKRNKKLFEKSIFLNKSLFKNHKLSFEDLSFKKPVIGIHASDYQKCIGKKLKKNIKINHPLKWKDIK